MENRRGARRRAPIGFIGLFALAVLGSAGSATAQDTGPYVLIGSGFGIVGDLETDFGPDTADVEYDDAGLADLSLGWRVLSHLRLEANVNYRQHHIANVDGEGLDGFSHKGDLHVVGALGNVILDYPLGAQVERDSLPYGIPYVGFGVGVLWTKPRAELRTTPERKIRGEGTEFAWNVLAGVDVPLTRRVGLQVGYRYLESLDQSWKLRVGSSTTGDVDSPYRAHEGRVGLRIGY